MDLKSGYWQIKMNAADRPKTAFIVHNGLHEFSVMLLGLCNAPSIFQELMNNVLSDCQYKYAIAYIDDIFSKTFEDHVVHLNDVFQRREKAGLKLKLVKWEFLKEVQFLGHIVSRDGTTS